MKHNIDAEQLKKLLHSEMILVLFTGAILNKDDKDDELLEAKKMLSCMIEFLESDEGVEHVDKAFMALLLDQEQEPEEEKLIQTLA